MDSKKEEILKLIYAIKVAILEDYIDMDGSASSEDIVSYRELRDFGDMMCYVTAKGKDGSYVKKQLALLKQKA